MAGLWDLHQELSIRDLRANQANADIAVESRVKRTQDRTDRLEDRFERLLLVTEAIWVLTRDKLGLTEDDLIRTVVELDGRDGAVDGHRTRPARKCTACGAAVSKEFSKCLFCGAASPPETAIDAV
ncbi:MAG: hypothetical protein JWM05_2864 [Acidimicrobiales bacterium]|nr:hypothetical protein [Acidimicrobiales bacterium]